MAPPSGLSNSTIPSEPDISFPPLVRSSTVPVSLGAHLQRHHDNNSLTNLNHHSQHNNHRATDPSHLAPEDAFSPPRRLPSFDHVGSGGESMRPRRLRRKDGGGGDRSRSRRRKRFQKLLWVKQSYPDNYTDQATFLENLQRNPRVQPYDFWPLVSDSTVIVQHVCSVIIFVVCFVGIFQERVSPVAIVGWGSCATFIGWVLWDWWVGEDGDDGTMDGVVRTRSIGGRNNFGPPSRQNSMPAITNGNGNGNSANGNGGAHPYPNASTTSLMSSISNLPSAASSTTNLFHQQPGQDSLQPPSQRHSLALSSANSSTLHLPRQNNTTTTTNNQSVNSLLSTTSLAPTNRSSGPNSTTELTLKHRPSSPLRSNRTHLRLSTIKSAVLIYFTLLGLSPILKSLTRSTSSDSIWAMSFWLLTINIFFFDYSTEPDSKSVSGTTKRFPPVASLSTNAALMASTVLASRLPSTGQVFSLTLFSIEVFGLFPVFRRYARHRSWRYHVGLTVLLVLGAGGGVGMVLGSTPEEGGGWWVPWRSGLAGCVVGCLIATLAMGGCSWWLISLQKYKNEIYGPWDPARPIIISRRHWEDD